MKKLSFYSVLFLSLLFLTACSKESVATEVPMVNETATSKANSNKVTATDGFTTPLFGLATAPNGDILVADGGAGIANATGTTTIPLPGITDIAPIGTGSMWAITGAIGGPDGAIINTGQGLHRVSKGNSKLIANLFEYEEANDPDGAGVDSNPFGVASLGGNAALVTDAGGNDLLRVDNQGNIELLAVFPDEVVSTANLQNLVGCPNPDFAFICDTAEMPAQAVPTTVVVGPDGYYYVGELKGFPAPAGESNIWRISPNASEADCATSPDCMKLLDGGFTSIIDMAFCADGKLFVAELDEQSWFAVEVLGGGIGGRISAVDLETLEVQVVATGIMGLTGITFGKDGSLWATTNSLSPELAEVIKISM
ncbi:ScyD/ScyE family protein [Arenibacter sp. 6A1]|uniref:ScyD/ScyE family protein n=1 Tax=Arenibacter sp. 6A1 TaxID=2720391 RepID=UPI001447AF77|nr:ScyD/ScyE family protein [Arenibacter sp. 6A1]NKI26633.1 ScyD/ScyE family protein [Arenibacter sp. 6A1]